MLPDLQLACMHQQLLAHLCITLQLMMQHKRWYSTEHAKQQSTQERCMHSLYSQPCTVQRTHLYSLNARDVFGGYVSSLQPLQQVPYL